MRRANLILLTVGTAAVLYGCGKPGMVQPSSELFTAQSTEQAVTQGAEQAADPSIEPTADPSIEKNSADSTDLSGTGEKAQKPGRQRLPEYVYTGGDPYIGGICDYLSEQAADKERGDVYIPIPLVLKTTVAASEGREVLVHGSFCDVWYELDGTNLFCVNYGENTGLLHMKKIDGSYKVTGFEKLRDGGDYPEDWKRLCKDDEVLYESLFQREEYEDKREAVRREIIARYVKDNGLDIETYQDYGWEPQKLTDSAGTDSGKEGKSYEKVPDLVDGKYKWASALTAGRAVKDKNGCENIDYNSQSRSFERLDGGKKLGVRRWDNLLYSAGDYLIYEYDGTVHVSKADDLYHPVLSYDKGATHQIVTKVPDGYMIADDRKYTVAFYDEEFQLVRVLEGYRYLENGKCYCDGLMAVRDMNTGLMGFMDQSGDMAIPCDYGYVSDFSNGYASVLAGGRLRRFTEESGTVSMFDVEGGQWGIIDIHGNYVVKPSEKYANPEPDPDAPSTYYCGPRRFSEVQKDGTADFIDISAEENQVIETVRVR